MGERKPEVHNLEAGSLGAAYYDAMKYMLACVTLAFPEVDEIAASGIIGSILGTAMSCGDDRLNHTDAMLQTPEAFNPLEQTFMVNFKNAYKEHRHLHLRIREGEATADEMLQKVCESHKKG